MDELTDQQLIEEYLEGDAKSFEHLLDRYLSLVVNFLNSIVGNRQSAEDLSQEVFVKVWRNIKKFHTEKNFKTWLLVIAKNTALDYLRKQKIKSWEFDSLDDEEKGALDLPSLEPLPDEILSRKELVVEINNLVNALNSSERTLIELYYREQMTFEEIAEILGESVNSTKSRHRRLLLKLRNKL